MPEGHVWLRVRPASGLPRRSLPTPTLFAHALWHGGCLRRPRLPRRVGRSFFRHNHRVERTCASPSQPMSLAFPAIHIFRLAALLCLSASVLICRSWLDFVFAAFRADLGEVLFVVHSVLAFSLAALIMRRFWRISLLRRSTLCSDDVSPRFIAIAVIQISYESSSQWWDVGCIPFSSR